MREGETARSPGPHAGAIRDQLCRALSGLREATEVDGTVVFCEPLDLQSTSAPWQFRETLSLVDTQCRLILLGVLLDGRICTAEIAPLPIRREGQEIPPESYRCRGAPPGAA